MSPSPRRLAPWLFVALLALPTVPAAALPFDTDALFAKLRGWLSLVWQENGCELEPLGRCGAAAAPNGCVLEPDGRCRPFLGDHGCEIDPFGRCANLLSENGCELEPNGRCGN